MKEYRRHCRPGLSAKTTAAAIPDFTMYFTVTDRK